MNFKPFYYLLLLAGFGVSGSYAQKQDVKNDSVSFKLIIPGIEVVDKGNIPYMEQKVGHLELQKINTRDIGDMLRTIPNISGIRKGGSGIDPVVRGFRYGQVNVMIDNGIKVEGGCPSRMDPTASHIEMEDVRDITVTKGPYMLRYGPAMGGVISLNTFQPVSEEFSIHVKALSAYESNWNGHRQYLNINGGNRQFNFFISGGFKNYDSYSNGEGVTVNSSFLKYNYAAGIGFMPFKNHHLNLVWRESHGRDVKYPSLPMDEREDNTRIASIDYNIVKLSPRFTNLAFKIYQSDVYHEMDNHDRSNFPSTDAVAKVDAVNTGFRTEARLVCGKSTFITGLDLEDVRKDGTRIMIMAMSGMTGTMTKKTNLWYNAVIDNAGIFGEWHKSSGRIDWTASLRIDANSAYSDDTLKIVKEGVDYFKETSSNNFCYSASAGMNIKTSDNTDLKFSIGRGERSPNMTERFIKFMTVGYDNYDYLGDPQLLPEANHQADLTFVYHTPSAGMFQMNYFYSFVDNYISGKKLAPSVATPKTMGALGVKQFYNADYAIFRGFEISYNSPAEHNLKTGISAAYTYATISETTRYIIDATGSVTGSTEISNDPLPEIPPLEANIFVDYDMFKKKLSARVHWRVVNSQIVVSEAMYEPETKGFGILNASITYNPTSYFTITGGINNAFDKAYYEHLNRKIVGSTVKLYEPGRSLFIQAVINI